MKSNFVLWQQRYYNLLTEEKDEKIHVFEELIFWKKYCYCQSQEIFFKQHLYMVYFCILCYRRASSHRVLHILLLGSYNKCIIYLHVTEACLKVINAMFYFYHSKNFSNIMKNIFNSISIYFWKKMSSLTKIRNKSVTHFFMSNMFLSNARLKLAKK